MCGYNHAGNKVGISKAQGNTICPPDHLSTLLSSPSKFVMISCDPLDGDMISRCLKWFRSSHAWIGYKLPRSPAPSASAVHALSSQSEILRADFEVTSIAESIPQPVLREICLLGFSMSASYRLSTLCLFFPFPAIATLTLYCSVKRPHV